MGHEPCDESPKSNNQANSAGIMENKIEPCAESNTLTHQDKSYNILENEPFDE